MNKKVNLNEENIKLRIESEVIKKQLISVRDMLNRIIGDSDENELIKKYVGKYENYKKMEKLEKQVLKQDELRKCVNCRQEGKWERSFCPQCLTTEKESNNNENK